MGKQSVWAKLVREQGSSGQSAASFCRERGISESAFSYWRQKLRRADGKLEGFARVTTDELVSVELPGGRTVRVSRDNLSAVLEALCGR